MFYFKTSRFAKLIVALDARQADGVGKLAIGSGPTHCKAHLKLGCSPARVASFHDCVVASGGPLVLLPMLADPVRLPRAVLPCEVSRLPTPRAAAAALQS